MMNKDLEVLTYDELYEKYLQYIEDDEDDIEEDIDYEEDDIDEEDEWESDFEEAWEDSGEANISFEDWLEMCGYYEVEEGLYKNS